MVRQRNPLRPGPADCFSVWPASASSPAHWDAAKIAAYRVEVQAILEALGDADGWLVARLAEKIAGYG